jgi:hypothetical protein
VGSRLAEIKKALPNPNSRLLTEPAMYSHALAQFRSVRRPPGFIEPCLPTSSRTVPAGPQWIYEVKQDGFRFSAAETAPASAYSAGGGTIGRIVCHGMLMLSSPCQSNPW